jgi:hypothetical protein
MKTKYRLGGVGRGELLQLLPSVQAATGSQLSLPTLRRYGKEELRIKSKATKKRTAVESESQQHTHSGWVHLNEL